MNKPQCQNCKSYKVSTQSTLAFIFGGCAMIIPPIGIIGLLAAIVLKIYDLATGKKQWICLQCHNRFTI